MQRITAFPLLTAFRPPLNVLCIGSRGMEAGEGAVGAARPEIANFFDGPADFLADDTRAQHRAGPY